jgi:signal transduction histidine kinase
VTERTARRLAHGLWLVTMGGWLLGVVLRLTEDAADSVPGLLLGLPIVLYASLGALVARRRPDNPIGWLFGAVALSLGLAILATAYARSGLDGGPGSGSLPGATVAAWVGTLSPFAVLPWALPTFLMLFPGGHLPSRRWRLGVGAAALGSALMVVGFAGRIAVEFGSSGLTSPDLLARLPGLDLYPGIGLSLVVAAAFAGMVALVRRFRSASAEERQPLRLLVVMIAAMAASSSAALAIAVASRGADWGWFGWIFAVLVDGFGVLVGIPVATAAAVLTFGLYDVGVVMKKTVVYGLLVVLFVLLVGFVSLFLSPLGIVGTSAGSERGDVIARIVTAASVMALALALGLRPAKRLARRLVFGKRATPYEAMAEFSERLGETYATDDVLPRMAEIVRASTGADVARVWLLVGRELRPVACAPRHEPEPSPLPALDDVLPEIPGARAFPVRHRGALLGALTVAMPRAEPLSKTGEKLVTDLAGQAGLVLRNVRLIEELQESRRRIVAAQDAERRRVERNIHDGAQQQLVALAVKLRLADQMVERDPAKTRELLDQLQAQAHETLEDLRDLARGIYPPLLADEGLAAALVAQGRKVAVPVEVRPDGIGRYAQEVEAAVYFCVLEALQNVTKYARASRVDVTLEDDGHGLAFAVSDDGVGFDRASPTRGTGLQGMADRLDAVGGSLEVRSGPEEGTTVLGRVPVR